MRRLLVAIVALGLSTIGLPAHAAEHTGTIAAPYADWAGLGFAVGAGHGSATLQGFLAACASDYLSDGSRARDAFLSGPLNGYDAFVVDLGAERTGAFSVRGPGATLVGIPIPTAAVFGSDIQLTSYDLDLEFYTDVGEVCADANFVDGSDDPCFSSRPDPDESTPCIKGYEASDGVIHGARYVVVVASLNVTGAPLDFTLSAP